jgi:iron-sulfur cluster assembly accessory protein
MDLPILNQTNQAKQAAGVTLSPLAAEKVVELLNQRPSPEFGLRVGVRGGGCSGNSYFMEFCPAAEDGDEVFDTNGVKLVVDRRSLPLLEGTQIDFVDSLMGSGFKFNNPNVRHSCACGESFTA